MGINPTALALANQINKKIGADVVTVASELVEPPRFTSGSLYLDLALGGGWPGNQWVEVYGKESHGKTTVVLKTIAANQAKDEDFTVLWIAAEHYDKDQAEALGVDNSRVVVLPTQDMTMAYEKVIEFAKMRAADCVVIDSYPALVPPEEDEKSMDDVQVALGARTTGKFFRKIGFAMHREEEERPILGIFINQQRDKIGGYSPFGVPQTTPGGNGKNYAFYTRVEVKRDKYIEEKIPGIEGKTKVGQKIKVITAKNKAAAPQQTALIDFYFRDAPGLGFKRGEYDLMQETISLAFIYEVIVQKGSTYTFGDRTWRGKDKVIDSLYEEPDLFADVERDIRDVALRRPDQVLSDPDPED